MIMETNELKTQHENEIEIKTEPEDNVEGAGLKTHNKIQFNAYAEAVHVTEPEAEVQCSSKSIFQTVLKSEIDINLTNVQEPSQLDQLKQACVEPVAVTGGQSEKKLKVVYAVKSKVDVDSQLILDSPRRKLFDLERLREYGDVPFVIKRMEPQDLIITYSKAINSVEAILERLCLNYVPNGIGIAFRIANHTPSSCILTLA